MTKRNKLGSGWLARGWYPWITASGLLGGMVQVARLPEEAPGAAALGAAEVEEEEDSAAAMWDALQGRGEDGHLYTILRHAVFGFSIELWHDSMGAFHLVVPYPEKRSSPEGMGSYTAYCCFSTGILVLEDDCCAPRLLRALVDKASTWSKGSGWERRGAKRVPRGGMAMYSSAGEVTWTMLPSEGRGALAAAGGLLIRHAQTDAEILLTRKGLWFLGTEGILQPVLDSAHTLGDITHDDEPAGREDRDPARRAPADPCGLQSLDVIEGISWTSSWRPRGDGVTRWAGSSSAKGRHQGLVEVTAEAHVRIEIASRSPTKGNRPRTDGPGKDTTRSFRQNMIARGRTAGVGFEELHSIMFCAAQQGWNEIWVTDDDGDVRWYCEANDRFINPNWRDSQGRTALMHAAGQGHAEMVSSLLKKGADPNSADPLGHTPLFFLLSGEAVDEEQRGATMAVLLVHGSNIHAQNFDGVTPLMLAAGAGNLKCVQELLYRGADVSAIDRNGFTASKMATCQASTATALSQTERYNQIAALLNDPQSLAGLTLSSQGEGAATRARSPLAEDDRRSEGTAEGTEWAGEEEEQAVVCVLMWKGPRWVSLLLARSALQGQGGDQRGMAETSAPDEGAKLSAMCEGVCVMVRGGQGQAGGEGVVEADEEGGLCVRMRGTGAVVKYKASRVLKVKVGEGWKHVELEVPRGCAPVRDGGRLERAEESGCSVYAELAEFFQKQATPTTCGPCSVMIVENFLRGLPESFAVTEGDVLVDVEEMGTPLSVLQQHGMTLDQVQRLCVRRGMAAQFLGTDEGFKEADFRKACYSLLNAESGAAIVCNFYMGPREKRGIGSVFEMGHFSPVAAYDAETDSVLVLDVWTLSPMAYWVPLPVLWSATCTGKDEVWGGSNVSTRSRGCLIVQVLVTNSGPAAGRQGMASRGRESLTRGNSHAGVAPLERSGSSKARPTGAHEGVSVPGAGGSFARRERPTSTPHVDARDGRSPGTRTPRPSHVGASAEREGIHEAVEEGRMRARRSRGGWAAEARGFIARAVLPVGSLEHEVLSSPQRARRTRREVACQ